MTTIHSTDPMAAADVAASIPERRWTPSELLGQEESHRTLRALLAAKAAGRRAGHVLTDAALLCSMPFVLAAIGRAEETQ